MEDILRTLVGFRTVSGDRAPADAGLRYVADFVARRGMHVAHYEHGGFPSLVATTKRGDLAPTVLLVAHLDVVPAADEMFALRVKDGKFFGRGVYDMKSGLAVFLQLIDDLKDDLADYSLGLMVTTDEEIGGRNGAKYLVDQGYRPQVCVIPDGGDNWHIETFEKGVQWIKLEAKGVAGHASRPWEGEHAVHKLLGALAEIRQHFPIDAGKKDTLLSVGTIKGGQTANQIAESAEAMLDVRTGSRADHVASFPTIERICRAHDVHAKLLVSDMPCVNNLEDPFISRFRDILVDRVGYWPGTAYSYAVTDGRFFSALDTPCIITMPPGGGWHGTEEWVSVAGCEQYRQILREFVDRVAQMPATRANADMAAVRELLGA